MLELILSIVLPFYCLLQYARFQALDLKFNFCQICHTITNINDFIISLSFHHLFSHYLYAGWDSSDKGENDQ